MPEIAYEYLHEAILSGQLNEGDTVHQEDVANRLGASRVPVREALKQLESEGLVVQRPRRGYVVASLDPEAIEDVFDIRMMLEERAAFLAAARRSQADVEEVSVLFEGMNAAHEDPAQVDSFRELHAAFHYRILSVSRREHLMRAITMQRNLVERYIRLGGAIARDPEAVREEHQRIFDAFRRGDPEQLARETRLHAQHTGDRLLLEIKRKRSATAR